MLHTRTALIVTALSVAACTGAPPPITELAVDTLADGTVLVSNPPHGLWDANPETRWRLVESLRIGGATEGGPDAFGRATSVAVDTLDRLWIVDSQANEVRVFDGEGRFVRTIGGPGEGPAEFMGLRSVGRGPDGEMWAADHRLERYEIFDTAGTRIGGQRFMTRFGGGWRNGLFLAYDGPEDSDRYVYRVYRRGATGRLGPDGRVFELPEDPPDPPMIEFKEGGTTLLRPAPFSPHRWWTFGPDLNIWWSDGVEMGGRYELREIDLETGRTLRRVLRQYEPVPISEDVRVAAIQTDLESVRHNHNMPGAERPPPEAMSVVPRVYPPFERFSRSREGTLWVRRMLGDGVFGFDVFDSEGRYLGQPELPAGLANIRVQRVDGERMYVIDTDEMGVIMHLTHGEYPVNLVPWM
ncbi:MAG: 6-bladed beta-propeller, partial [Gemmatimonadota bacterium]|nr:6-bladed beta-propeller [Gemmatimonadota bacterium]